MSSVEFQQQETLGHTRRWPNQLDAWLWDTRDVQLQPQSRSKVVGGRPPLPSVSRLGRASSGGGPQAALPWKKNAAVLDGC